MTLGSSFVSLTETRHFYQIYLHIHTLFLLRFYVKEFYTLLCGELPPTPNNNWLLSHSFSFRGPLFSPLLSSPLAGHYSAVFLCVCENHLQCHFTALACNRCEGGRLLLWCLVPNQKAQIIHAKLQFTLLRSTFDIGAYLILRPDVTLWFSWCSKCCFFVTPEQSIGVLRPMKSCRKSPFVAQPHLLGSGTIN